MRSPALILCNLSASNIVVNKADERADAVCLAVDALPAYVYSAAGPGESTTDLAWDGQATIHELGTLLAQTRRFPTESQMAVADVDVERVRLERMRTPTFNSAAAAGGHPERHSSAFASNTTPEARTSAWCVPSIASRTCRISWSDSTSSATRSVQHPGAGLTKRLQVTNGQRRIVIGVPGGLDSTHALLVAAKTFDAMRLPRKNILGFTMPGFATSEGTKSNAWSLMRSLGITGEEIDIKPAALQMLKDIGHPYARGEPVFDVTFENVQAGLRTDYLFRLANQRKAFVLGTGTLSSSRWAGAPTASATTSHYNVNGSVPKTLIQYLVRWVVETRQLDAEAAATLIAILDTEISPELVPAAASGDLQARSRRSDLTSFRISTCSTSHASDCGLKSRVPRLARVGDIERGAWPPNFGRGEARLHAAGDQALAAHLPVPVLRDQSVQALGIAQRTEGADRGSLSPRGDWRARRTATRSSGSTSSSATFRVSGGLRSRARSLSRASSGSLRRRRAPSSRKRSSSASVTTPLRSISMSLKRGVKFRSPCDSSSR